MVEHIKEVLRESVNRKDPSYARNNLTEEEKDYLFNDMENSDFDNLFPDEENDYFKYLFYDIFFKIYTSDQALKKRKNIDKLSLEQQTAIISCLPSDEMKLAFYSKIYDSEAKAVILSSLSDDREKLNHLKEIKQEDWDIIIERLSNDESKIALLAVIECSNYPLISEIDESVLQSINFPFKFDKKMSELTNNLFQEDLLFYNNDTFSNQLTITILQNLSTDALKIKGLNLLDDLSKTEVINSLSNDNQKLENLHLLTDEMAKAKVISSLSNDNQKLENLHLLTDEMVKANVISQLGNDKYKEKGLSLLKDDKAKVQVIASLRKKENIAIYSWDLNDNAKIKLMKKLSDEKTIRLIYHQLSTENQVKNLDILQDEWGRCAIIKSFSTDDQKLQGLKFLKDEFLKTQIIIDLSTDDLKLESLSLLSNEKSKAEVISNLSTDSLKLENLSLLSSNRSKAEVISNLSTDSLKLENLSLLSDEQSRALVIENLTSPDEKIKHLMNIKNSYYRYNIISKMEEKYKIKALNNEVAIINSRNNNLETSFKDIQQMGEQNLKDIIITLKNVDEKIKLLRFLSKDVYLLEVANSLETEEQKLEAIKVINSNAVRLELLFKFSEENLKLGLDYLPWFSNEENKGYNKKLKIIEEYQKMLEEKNDYSKNAFVNYIENHHENLDESTISHIVNILNRFSKSNSLELSNLKEQLTPLVLSTQNPIESFNKIEKIFLKNNIPMFGKEFLCFQSLYPEFQKREGNKETFDFTEGSRISPELLYPTQTRKMKVVSKNATDKDIRFQIVFNDLLRIASHSNNRSLIEYLNNIEYGNTLFLGISKGIIKFNDLDDKSKQILDVFSNHLAALYENTEKGSEEIFENLSTVERIAYFSRKFSPTSRYDLPDRIVRSFAYQAGIENFEQLKNIVINSVREKEEVSKKRSEELKNGKKLVLEPGDFVRGIGNIDCVESSLNNGNVCKEFLGTFLGESDSDTTPLDVDLTLITEENTDIYHNIKGTPTGFGFGNVYVILKKGNPNLNITRDKEGNLTGNEYDPSKVEVFGTSTQKGGYETHWGARTGIASSDIDYILFKEDLTIDSSDPYSEDGKVNYILPESEFEKKEYYGKHQNDLAILKNEVVKNGFYIPIVDFSGKIIFTDEEYQELKQKMEGLSHYGSKEYHLEQHQYSDYTERIKGLLASNKQETKIQSQKVYQALSDIIQSIPMDENSTKTLQAKNKIGIDLTPGSVEVLETGSSVRGTNVPYDFDFDYIFRLDSNIINDDEKMHQFRTKICEALNIASVPSDEFRDVEATIPGLGTIKLDITFIQKNDKVEYSTEMALQDRMDTIYKSNPAVGDEVTANIILAKLLLKQAGCYKPKRKDPYQGGLGGVGIENWITQNGGTLETAANSFLKASEGKTYEEFKLIYHIHDYGKNHLYKEKKTYPYDDFIFNNMNRIGYQKMQEVLRKYIRYLSGEKDLFPELEEVLNALEQQQEKEVTITHSRGIVSFFILISLSLLISIITIIYILLRK